MFPSRRIAIGGGDKFESNYSLHFNGTDEYLELGDITTFDGLGDYSFVYWVKLLDDNTVAFMSKGYYAAAGSSFGGYYTETVSSGRFRFSLDTTTAGGSGKVWYVNNVAQYLPQNQWHHVVVTVSDTNDRAFVYFNGKKINLGGTYDAGNYQVIPSEDTHTVRIGRESTIYSNFKLAEVVAYNSELLHADVLNLYNEREPYNHREGRLSNNLILWVRMGDGLENGSGTTIYDGSVSGKNATATNMDDTNYKGDVPW